MSTRAFVVTVALVIAAGILLAGWFVPAPATATRCATTPSRTRIELSRWSNRVLKNATVSEADRSRVLALIARSNVCSVRELSEVDIKSAGVDDSVISILVAAEEGVFSRRELKCMQESVAAQHAAAVVLRDEQERCRLDVNRTQATCRRAQEQAAHFEDALRRSHNESDAENAQIIRLNALLKTATERVAELTPQLKAAQDAAASSATQLQAAQARVAELAPVAERVETATRDLKAAQDQLASMSSSVQSLVAQSRLPRKLLYLSRGGSGGSGNQFMLLKAAMRVAK